MLKRTFGLMRKGGREDGRMRKSKIKSKAAPVTCREGP
jgi:hypothetical protein